MRQKQCMFCKIELGEDVQIRQILCCQCERLAQQMMTDLKTSDTKRIRRKVTAQTKRFTYSCLVCGHRLNRDQITCSQSCLDYYKQHMHKLSICRRCLNPIVCGGEQSLPPKYCNRKCYLEYRNKLEEEEKEILATARQQLINKIIERQTQEAINVIDRIINWDYSKDDPFDLEHR